MLGAEPTFAASLLDAPLARALPLDVLGPDTCWAACLPLGARPETFQYRTLEEHRHDTEPFRCASSLKGAT